MTTYVEPSSVVAFSVAGTIARAIEEAAGRELITRSSWARKVILAHLITTGAITGQEAFINKQGPKPKEAA